VVNAVRAYEMLKYATILILAITFICDAAFAQNSNCFRPTMPPMDVIAACDAIIDTEPRAAQAHQARGIAYSSLNVGARIVRGKLNLLGLEEAV
jgi:hypothetical protein